MFYTEQRTKRQEPRAGIIAEFPLGEGGWGIDGVIKGGGKSKQVTYKNRKSITDV